MATQTRQLAILHLSDLHFGREHRFDPPPTPRGDLPVRVGYPTLLEKLQEDLAASDDTDSPMLICITGDLTTTATVEEFQQAETFVKGLIADPILGQEVTRDRLFMVPGNHDVEFELRKEEFRWQQWVDFYNRLYRTTFQRERVIDMVELRHLSDVGAVVLVLNSALYIEKGSADEDRGHVDGRQLDKVEEALERFGSDGLKSYIKIAIIHHHPVLIPSLAEPGRGYDAVHNSGMLLALLRRYGFHLLLHGHKHNPHLFTDDSRGAFGNTTHQPIYIVAGGSVGSTHLPDGPKRANTYNRILVKWHPEAGQSRIIVETRALSVFREDGTERIPGRWSWHTLAEDDRSFYGSRRLPPVKASSKIPYDVAAMKQCEDERVAEYVASRGNIPVIEVIPSVIAGQAYEARVWIVPHRREEPQGVPVRVLWSAGPKFPTLIVRQDEDPDFCATFDYWGPMLIQARLEFRDETSACMHVYARVPQRYPAEREEAER